MTEDGSFDDRVDKMFKQVDNFMLSLWEPLRDWCWEVFLPFVFTAFLTIAFIVFFGEWRLYSP